MSNAVFPTSSLKGLAFSSFKMPTWARRMQRSVSGRELAVQDYANPIWNIKLTFSFLRDFTVGALASEMRLLMDFINQALASGDTFLWEDRDDYTVTDEPIGTGDGTTVDFQLVRRLVASGFAEDIIAPHNVANVYVNGIDPGGWSVDAATGIVTMGAAPALGEAITADFTYYFRCRFSDDAVEFERFAHQFWSVKELRFRSVVL